MALIYLASTSPRRRQLLRQLGLRFRTVKPAFVEPVLHSHPSPALIALHHARSKALTAARRVPAGFVIGVDTIVVLGNRILGKPRSRAEALRMLKLLSGRTHRVISGLAVVRCPDKRLFSGTETTRVAFRRLTSEELSAYVATSEPYDKAGAYAIQGRAGIFVRRLNGCFLNVIGLPLALMFTLLGRAGWRSNQGEVAVR